MQSLVEYLLEKRAQRRQREFAPGIPASRAKRSIPRVARFGQPTTWWYVDHKHEAVRAGLHSDLRLSDGQTAFSWAVRKGIPKMPGEKVLAVLPGKIFGSSKSRCCERPW